MKKKTTMGPAPKFTGKRLEVRLSPEERRVAERAAREQGMTLSDFVRAAIDCAAPPTEPAPIDDRCETVVERLPPPPATPRELRDTARPGKAAAVRELPFECYFCQAACAEKIANGCACCDGCKRQFCTPKGEAA